LHELLDCSFTCFVVFILNIIHFFDAPGNSSWSSRRSLTEKQKP
jgi:hypothetical protein